MITGWDEMIYASNASVRRNFQKAVKERGYLPLPYGEREKIKREGWREVYNQSLPLSDRIAGAEKVMRGWYDRSLAAAYLEGKWCWGKHPDFSGM